MRAIVAALCFALSVSMPAAPARAAHRHHSADIHFSRFAHTRHARFSHRWRTPRDVPQGDVRSASNVQPWTWREAPRAEWRSTDTRPSAWCGWWMRHLLGVADRAFNLAANWAHWGRPSGGPRVGAVVVWRHHVGIIRGGPDASGRWLVESGNDAHAVRTRYRSLAGAIAFRRG